MNLKYMKVSLFEITYKKKWATLKIGSQITIQIKQRPLDSFKMSSHHHEEAGTTFIDIEKSCKAA